MSVASYGYVGNNDDTTTSRMMFGHVQRAFRYSDEDSGYGYRAYELGFPAFAGQSGSPVMLNREGRADMRRTIVAVVTAYHSYSRDAASATWALGIVLAPFSDWLSAVSRGSDQ